MTKHILRIIVTIVLVGALGFTAWNYFFKPNNTEIVYSRLETYFKEIDNDDSVERNFVGLKMEDYFGKYTSADKRVFSKTNTPEVWHIRELLFGLSESSNFEDYYSSVLSDYDNDEIKKHLSYTKSIILLDNVLADYFYVTPFAKNVTNSAKSNVIKDLNALNSKYEVLNESIKVLINFQINNTKPNDAVQYNSLVQYYVNVVNNLREYVYAYTNFVSTVKDYVIKFVYNNNYSYDINYIFNESILLNVKKFVTLSGSGNDVSNFTILNDTQFLSNNTLINNTYLYDAFIIALRYNDIITDKNIEIDKMNWMALNAFNNLRNNYNVVLFGNNSVLLKTNNEKIGIADGTATEEIALIKAEFLEDVQVLLQYLGFSN